MNTTLPRRLLGGTLVLLSFVPVFRILDAQDDNFRRTSVEVAEATLAYVQTAALTALLLGVVAAFFVPRARLLPVASRLGRGIETLPPARWAALTAIVGFAFAALVNVRLYQGMFTNVDEIASFIHARYLAAGELAGTLPASAEGWLIPNMLTVDSGWVSQFPPSHLVLMAAFIRAGAPALLGPVLFAALVAFTALSLPRLMPEHVRAARVAAALVAASPFLVLLGAGSLSHVSAGAFLWLALYAALRARDGSWSWSILAGSAVGVAVTSRPWIGVLLGTVGTLGIWLPHLRDRAGRGAGAAWLARRCFGTVLGGIPFALALGWYNRALFGGLTTLGYVAAFGERHRLGFHPDPWGNNYTVVDAIGFTSTDLIAFGTQLLETPIPVGLAIGLWLLLSRTLPRGAAFLLAFALVPVLGNMLYWFHTTRMLYEAAPAWLALACLSLAPLLNEAPPRGDSRRRLEPGAIAVWSALSALGMAAVLGVPDRISSYAWDEDVAARITIPGTPAESPALVFVHTSWNERLSARLQSAGGMRQDSVISVLRRNTNCGLQLYSDARAAAVQGGGATLPDIDLRQLPGAPPDLIRPPAPDGTTLRTRHGERFPPACTRELNADRFGAVALAPLLWQGDLPTVETGAPLFVRDLGPEVNGPLLESYPDRQPWVFVPKRPGAPPELVGYSEAMRILWGN